MRTFFDNLRSGQRPRLRRPHLAIARTRAVAHACRERVSMRLDPGAQDGFLLIEVIVSALLVALIVVATFNGFDVVNRAQAEDRAHDQAVILAAESQEQLRTDPVSTLQALETTPHTYTQTVNGTSYEITQEAAPSNGSANTTGCSAVETTKQTGANVEITSAVTWAALGITKRPEIKLSSIITPPTGAGLEVDVGNNPSPTEGVSGVTAVVTFTPVNSTTAETREGITNSAGCVVFGDIESTAATVEIKEKSGFVTTSGTLKVPPKEVALAPNITVHDAVTYDQGGAIKAKFTWKGESVTGDNFVVVNGNLPAPKFQVGSNLFSYEATGEEQYAAKTGKYASSATTAKGTRYSTGDLFPFLLPNYWEVYSGDCLANSPHLFNAAIKNEEVLVKPGGTTEVSIPISKTNLAVREGTKASSSAGPSGLQVKITDTSCSASSTPNNASTLNVAHEQKTTSEGKLEFPFQPWGSYEVCIANEATKKRYKYLGSNTTEEGSSPTVYLGAKSSTEKSEVKTKKESEEKATKTTRESEETTAKSKRVSEEATAKSARESAEATAKAKRETEEKPAKSKWETEEKTEATLKTTEEATKATRIAKEKTEKEQWKKEEECEITKNKNSAQCIASGKKEITGAEKTAKEKAQETTRKSAETTETTAETKRKTEETATKAARTAQEATQKAKEKEESEAKTKKEKEEKEAKEKKETEEATLKTKKLGEEETTKKAREKVETEESEEATTTKVTVESGASAEKC
jgi:Tfp pilus assembly protein PilV